MPSYFTQVFSNVMVPPAVKRNLDFSYRHMPMLNEVSTSLSSYLASQGQISRKKTFMRWYKNTPELVGFINKVVSDMCSRYHFEAIGKAGSGRNRILKAQRFAMEVGYRQLREEVCADGLITGDGIAWMGQIPLNTIKSTIKDKLKEYLAVHPHIEVKEKESVVNSIFTQIKENYYQKIEKKHVNNQELNDTGPFLDEDVLAPKVLRYVPSTTVEVVYDRYDIKGYNHFLGVYLPMFFSPEEIIHFTFMKRDGKVNGFTPVESIIVQLELLRQMWQNQLALHKNGGYPDKVFVLENTSVSSPAYQRIKEEIEKYKLAENKHGNMVFTGKVNVLELQQLDQMQFKDVGLYVTGLVAMQWGIPRSSIPFIIGGTNTKDDTGGNSERGYWEFIKGFQDKYDEIWNTQLWIPYFGVKLVSENSYMQMDIQKEQALQAKLQNLNNIDMLLSKHGKILSFKRKMEVIGYQDDDIEDVTPEMMQQQLGFTDQGSNVTKDKQVSQAKTDRADMKRTEQNNTMMSRGKPTGAGKEKYDESLAEKPYNWQVRRDNAIKPQKSFAPGNMLTNSNLDNPAGNVNYSGNFQRDEGGYIADDTINHDTPQTKPKKRKGSYPTQRKYPDEPMQFPGKDEKESQFSIGMRIEHAEHPELPIEVIQQLVTDHLKEDVNYYAHEAMMGKSMDANAEIEFKGMQGGDCEDVDLVTFVKLFNEDKQYQQGQPPRIFMRRNNGIATLKFKSSDFVYRTQFAEKDIEDNESISILLMQLSGKIYRL